MSRQTRIRPATPDDFRQVLDEPLPYRVKAYALEGEDGLLGVGGFAYQPGGVIAAFLLKLPGMEKFPVSLHRAGMQAMQDAKRYGYRRIVALAQQDNPAAERWLKRFGFKQVMIDEKPAWVWER